MEYECRNCNLTGENITWDISPIACFNTNAGNLSINKGEIFPFYWNIEKLENQEKYYVTLEKEKKADADDAENVEAIENYEEYEWTKCGRDGEIALNSMKSTNTLLFISSFTLTLGILI